MVPRRDKSIGTAASRRDSWRRVIAAPSGSPTPFAAVADMGLSGSCGWRVCPRFHMRSLCPRPFPKFHLSPTSHPSYSQHLKNHKLAEVLSARSALPRDNDQQRNKQNQCQIHKPAEVLPARSALPRDKHQQRNKQNQCQFKYPAEVLPTRSALPRDKRGATTRTRKTLLRTLEFPKTAPRPGAC